MDYSQSEFPFIRAFELTSKIDEKIKLIERLEEEQREKSKRLKFSAGLLKVGLAIVFIFIYL